MLNIVLVYPSIPPNTGNIARTCAATGCKLHLIEPLGFDASDKAAKRAGLDYWPLIEVKIYKSLDDFFAQNQVKQKWLLSSKAPRSYTQVAYASGDYLFFGNENHGLPEDFLEANYNDCLRIPMRAEARCLNLSNAAAIVTYEAMRQLEFESLLDAGKMALSD